MKKIVRLALLSLVAGFLVFGVSSLTAAQGLKYPVKWKLGHVGASDHIFEIGAQKFAELVKERTNGKITIITYPGAALGGDRELVEGISLGTIELAMVGPIDFIIPVASFINLPFLFKNNEHAYKILDGPIGESIYSTLIPKNIRYLASFQNGWRHTTSNKAINSIDDLKGMKIRVPESKWWMKAFESFGAKPTPMAFPEVYSALQQGVIDGQENPFAHIVGQKFYEVQDYVALTGHMYFNAPLLIGEKLWRNLSVEMQAIIKQSAADARDYQRDVANKEADAQKKICIDAGMKVTTPDLAPFRAAVAPLHKEWSNEFGELLYKEMVRLGN